MLGGGGPAGSGDDTLHEMITVREVVGITRCFPKAAESREDNALVVGVDTFIARIALPSPNVRRASPTSDMEAIYV